MRLAGRHEHNPKTSGSGRNRPGSTGFNRVSTCSRSFIIASALVCVTDSGGPSHPGPGIAYSSPSAIWSLTFSYAFYFINLLVPSISNSFPYRSRYTVIYFPQFYLLWEETFESHNPNPALWIQSIIRIIATPTISKLFPARTKQQDFNKPSKDPRR